jgi:hypothetical protein
MLTGGLIILASFAYVGLLFGIAYYGDKRADAGRSIIANPYIYALSLAVYCTSWTFYGSVGRAATTGIGFLPIYLGPTLMAALWWYVMLKIIRISKANRITSIADFIASRYGKSQTLGGLVTVIAVVGIVPYIALQLKAISTSFSIIRRYPEVAMPPDLHRAPLFLGDNTFYIAMLLAAFTILFGTRHLDATERHEGLVAAVAFESLVKLLAFITVGVFVTFVMFDGFADLFDRAAATPQISQLLVVSAEVGDYVTWASLTFLSMAAIMFLPRQFQVAVVENVDERHLNRRPATDALDRDQLLDDGLVVHRLPAAWLHLALVEAAREVLHVGDLLAGEAAGAQVALGLGHDVGCLHLADAILEARPDRLRGLHRDLLADDGAGERLEGVAAQRDVGLGVLADEPGEHLVLLREVARRLAPVFRRHFFAAERHSTGSHLGGMSVRSWPFTSILAGTGTVWHSHAIGTLGSSFTTAGRSVTLSPVRALLALLP